jgi:kinetochore protein NDC80
VPRDPRPLKDRSYQAKIGQEMLDYLAQHNFKMEMKHTLSQNIIKSPTQKDVNYMFQWLYHRIDPSYRF